MFTGIIEGTGTLKNIEANIFTFTHPFENRFTVGESVACNGCCLTVLSSTAEAFKVEIIAESRQLTNFGTAQIGDLVNLERSAVTGQRNSGHNVTGHIDEVGTVQTLERQGDYWLLRVSVKAANRKLLVLKGSVALNGISLTISGVSDLTASEAWLEVSIISHTWAVTNLQNLTLGAAINVEYDILGKYALNLSR